MPPAICDSEDEDEILSDDGPSQRSTFSAHAAHAEAMLETFPNYDGAGDEQPASTTSSELRRQILSAERNLCATASLSTPAMTTSTSPVLQKDKRRKSTTIASEPVASPPKSTRRTKTANVKTYGKSNHTSQAAADDAAFYQLRDDANAPKASQSAKFTEHSSGPNPSSGLPMGTIRDDFVNHEPNVMFKDTGSTIAFNESSQQRLVEQALSNGEQIVTASEQKNASSAERQQSSPFPWSTSADGTQSQTNKQPETRPDNIPDAQTEGSGQPNAAGDTIEVATKQTPSRPSAEPAARETAIPPNEAAGVKNDAASKTSKDATQAHSKAAPPKSSPVVEIPRYHPSQDNGGTQTSRGRKRKAKDDDEEPLNSDDKAIGLPKENYKPRLSRRRATAVLEEPIDYSMIPEKAAKKRRKTAEGNVGTQDTEPADEAAAPSEKAKSVNASKAAITDEQDTTITMDKNDGRETSQSAPDQSKAAPSPEKELPPDNPTSAKDTASTKKAADAMLMKPPAVPASASKKVARSKTTIFEDHVNRAEKSPTLSQQQAKRNSAALDVSNEAKTDKRKKRRTIVQDDDDEDDEDELAKDMSEKEEVEVAPKKRGRPAKQKASKAKSKEKVLEDSDEEEDELELEVEEPPKKKGRGRPPKAKTDDGKKQKEASEPVDVATTSDMAAATAQSSPTKSALERKDSNARPQSKDTDNPNKDAAPNSADTPAQSTEKSLPSPQKTPAKPSPSTTHSPIKGSTFANYRVGLSKRSRIPSLLKSFRAPAPARR